MLTKYKIVPFCPYHFVHTILSNAILSVYHFVHNILSVPFCPLPFCPVTVWPITPLLGGRLTDYEVVGVMNFWVQLTKKGHEKFFGVNLFFWGFAPLWKKLK